jgi:hypothetical protein
MFAFHVFSPVAHKTIVQSGRLYGHGHYSHAFTPTMLASAVASGMGQFLLGAWLWVCGQQIGSVAYAGLRYWAVSDAFGVRLESVFPSWPGFGFGQGQGGERRGFGDRWVSMVLILVGIDVDVGTRGLILY